MNLTGMSAAAYMVFGLFSKPAMSRAYAAVMFSFGCFPTAAALKVGSMSK